MIYTRRLFGPQLLSNATTVMYTVPSGFTVVIRNLQFVNNNTTTTHVVRLGIGGTNNAQRVMRLTFPPEATTYLETRLALNAGEQLMGYVDTAGSVTTTVTGYVLAN